MKKILFTLFIISFFSLLNAQIPGNSWSIGFGGTFPRFHSTDVKPTEKNIGFYANLTRYFNDNVSLRFKGYFNYMTGIMPRNKYFYKTGGLVINEEEMNSSVYGLSSDLVYYFNPEDNVNMFFFLGVGGAIISSTWDNVVNPEADSRFTLQTNFGLGADWNLSENWKLKTELGYYNVGGRLDGVPNYNRQGIWGSNDDSYIGLNIGFDYYFSKCDECCQMPAPDGMSKSSEVPPSLTKSDVEAIVKKHIPKEVVKEIVVEKTVPAEKVAVKYIDNKPVLDLEGIYFETNSSIIKKESYVTLYKAYQYLSENNSASVEIQGYTDDLGDAESNKKLSQKRAEAVKEYLVQKGINADRLSAVGFGEENPVAPNTNKSNRSLNRRIEFKLK